MKKFKLDYSFVFFLLIIAFSPKQHILIKLILSLVLHEVGHLCCIYLFHYPIHTLQLSLFGFTLKLEETKQECWKDFMVYSGGILTNLISYLCFQDKQWQSIQIFLIFINVIPMYPLDGFNILKTILSFKIPYYYTLWITSIISIISSVVVFILFFIFKADLCLWFSIGYLFILNCIMLCNIKKRYQYFLLKKKIYSYDYPVKKIHFKPNYQYHLYFYHQIEMQLEGAILTEKELL